MVRFAGYAKKKEPKWPYVAIALTVLLAVIIVIFIASAVTSWLESEINKPVVATTTTATTVPSSTTSTILPAAKVATTTTTSTTSPASQKTGNIPAPAVAAATGIKIERIVIASAMNGNLPADDLAKISASGAIYCYTKMTNTGQSRPIKHVWIGPSGKVAAEVDLTARGGASATWSYIDVKGIGTGQWQVRVETKDGTILAEKAFVTY